MKTPYVAGTTAQATGGQEEAGNVPGTVCRPAGNVRPDAPSLGSGPVHSEGVCPDGNQPDPRQHTGGELRELLTSKTARRIAELEDVLDIADGHGIIEALATDVVFQIMNGDNGLVTGGWEFDDPKQAEADMRTLADRWKAEDALAKA